MTAPAVSTDPIDRLDDVTFVNGVLAGEVPRSGGSGLVAFLLPPEARLGLLCVLNTAAGSAGSVKFAERGCEP